MRAGSAKSPSVSSVCVMFKDGRCGWSGDERVSGRKIWKRARSIWKCLAFVSRVMGRQPFTGVEEGVIWCDICIGCWVENRHQGNRRGTGHW